MHIIELISKENVVVTFSPNTDNSVVARVIDRETNKDVDFRYEVGDNIVNLLQYNIEVLRIIKQQDTNIACNNG